VVRAWFVHFYTSLGLVAALLALIAIAAHNAGATFLFLGISLFIDATDGTMARAWEVKKYAPSFDGRKLDDIIDYMTYAFFPLFFAHQFGLVHGPGGLIVLGISAIAASYGFCQAEAKTDDGFYTGFPNYWNLIIFYMFLLKTDPLINGAILLILAVLVFVPVRYISFSTSACRRLTYLMWFLYSLNLMAILGSYLVSGRPVVWLIWLSLFGPIYYFAISIYLTLKKPQTS